jgi:hypothetical protein
MLCARCNQETPNALTCVSCGEDPLLRGRYRLDAVVGQGALGVTYRAERLIDGLTVAIKELPFRALDRFKTQALFEREARVLRQLSHPGIPTYIDDFTDGHGKHLSFCLVQAFISGQTLAQESSHRRYAEAEVWQVVADICDILTYLHGLSPPVIHRDIKPQNIMRRADGQLILIDFGAVRDSLKGPAGGSTVVGTFGFMPPEQFGGVARPGSDLYALGVTALALLSREDPARLMDAHHRLRWREVVALSAGGEALLGALLEPEVSARPSSAAEVGREARALASQRGGAQGGQGGQEKQEKQEVGGAPGQWVRVPARVETSGSTELVVNDERMGAVVVEEGWRWMEGAVVAVAVGVSVSLIGLIGGVLLLWALQ